MARAVTGYGLPRPHGDVQQKEVRTVNPAFQRSVLVQIPLWSVVDNGGKRENLAVENLGVYEQLPVTDGSV